MSDDHDPDSLKIIEAFLEEYRKSYEAGNRYAVLSAVGQCARARVVMPEWLVDAFHKAINPWNRLEVKTLDEAFGVQWPKGWHINAHEKFRRLGPAVYMRVKAERERGRAIDESLFEEIGRELNLGTTLTSDYYYKTRDMYFSRKK